ISPYYSHQFPPFPGPVSPARVEERIAEWQAGLQRSLSQLQLAGTCDFGSRADRRCNGGREELRSSDEAPMSQRPGSSRPSSESTRTDVKEKPRLPPVTQALQNQRSAGDEALLQHARSTSSESPNGASSRPPGPSGMQNLLNPTAREIDAGQGRLRSADQYMDSPAKILSTAHSPEASLSQNQGSTVLPSITPHSNTGYPALPAQNGRRILTPRPPSAGMYGGKPATPGLTGGKIDAKASPFMPSKDHANANSFPPSLPPVSMALSQAASSHPSPLSTASPLGHSTSITASQSQFKDERRPSGGASSSHMPASQSNSPSTSYSSYSRFSRTPPPPHATSGPTQPLSFFAQSYSDQNGHAANTQQPGSHIKESYGPMSTSTTQGNYQMMTLDTDQGPIQVPVDVQAASKVADEKRKRNATASHRFRQRRKEKERETSQNIAKLEHQIRDIAEEREYYRLERDYFRSVACNGAGPAHMAPRPPSPRHVRLASTSSNGSMSNGHWHEQDENERGARNTRRRTSSYAPATALVPPAYATPVQIPPFGANENAEQRLGLGARGAVISSPLPHGPFDPASIRKGWKH
ncbi:MAG: hypothetical protein Q9191_007456, partial [Dirinaria sp. TL-2023a]